MINWRLAMISLISLMPLQVSAQTVSHRNEFVDAGNGVVEWRVYLYNNGRRQMCCFVDMAGPRFSFGNRQLVHDSRALCAYPGRENYTGLRGVTTQASQSGTFALPKGSELQSFATLREYVTIGAAHYTIGDCSEQ
jgi:hypothetical protein